MTLSKLKFRSLGIGMVIFFSSLSTGYSAIRSIAELDNACLFKFAAFSDNRGETDQNAGKALAWIKANDKFALADGDIFDNVTADTKFKAMWKSDTYYHNNLYPTFGNHCSITYGSQTNWGRPAVTLDLLSLKTRSDVVFRKPTSEPVYGYKSKDDLSWVPYPDVYIDYYVKLPFGKFNVHIITVYKNDRAVFAKRTADFLYSKMQELAPKKTPYDIIVVQAHDERWLIRSYTEGFGKYPPSFTKEQVKFVAANADLVLCASDHRFRRVHEFDSWGIPNGALHIDCGQVYNADAQDGYVEFHVFDNPPRFTAQYINCNVAARALHVDKPLSWRIIADRGETSTLVTPMMKTIGGPITQPLDWSKFNVTTATGPRVSANTPGKFGVNIVRSASKTALKLAVPAAAGLSEMPMQIKIINMQGKEISKTNKAYYPGNHTIDLTGMMPGSGMFFVNVTLNGQSETHMVFQAKQATK